MLVIQIYIIFEKRSSGSIGIGNVLEIREEVYDLKTENERSGTRNRSPGLARDPSRLQERHLPTPLQIYDGIINNNKFVANLYKAK